MFDCPIPTEYVHLEGNRWCRIEAQEQSIHIFEEKINEFGQCSAVSREHELHILRTHLDDFVSALRRFTGFGYYPTEIKIRAYDIPLSNTVGTVKILCANIGCVTFFHRYWKKDILIALERYHSDLWEYSDTVRTSKVPKDCSGISIPVDKVEVLVGCIEKLSGEKNLLRG